MGNEMLWCRKMRQPAGYIPSIKTAVSNRHHTPGIAGGMRRKSSLEGLRSNVSDESRFLPRLSKSSAYTSDEEEEDEEIQRLFDVVEVAEQEDEEVRDEHFRIAAKA